MCSPRGFRSSRADAPIRVVSAVPSSISRTLLAGVALVLIASAGSGCEQSGGKKDAAERWFDDRPPTWDRWPGTNSNSGGSSQQQRTQQPSSDRQTHAAQSGATAGSNASSTGTSAGHHAGRSTQSAQSPQSTRPNADDAPPRGRSLLVGPGDPRLGPVPIDRVVNASGLVIEDLVRGEGATCLPGMRIRVRYTAAVLDGKVFDRADGDPVSLDLDECVLAWRQGLPGMRVGGVRQLISPPSLAFGDDTLVDDNDRVIVPAGSVIVFVVELLDIQPGGS